MRSTFMGLEIARRGMFTQQSALNTVGQNIANANTPGYSRQRVNFQSTSPYPAMGLNRVQLPGQTGTGVEAGSVQRIREGFLDLQFRVENNKFGYYGTLSESLTKMEEIMNEPSESGLQNTMDKFWASLQDLASHSENTGARDVVAANGQMVADTLNYYHNSLYRVQQDIGKQINVKVQEINSLVDNIDKINQQISKIEPHGYLPNDLYDQRDQMVDQLSSLVNIKVTSVKPTNYGNAKEYAEGLYNIELVQEDGNSFNPPVNLISVSKASGIIGTNKLTVSDDDGDGTLNGLVSSVKVGNTELASFNFSGELSALIESYGYTDGTETYGFYPDMLQKLNDYTEAFVNEFNTIHREGYDLNGQPGTDFFVLDPELGDNPAQQIKVSDAILEDSSLIAASLTSTGGSGDNDNAHHLAEINKKAFSEYETRSILPDNMSGSLDSFYAGIIGKLAVDSQGTQKNANNSLTLTDSVNTNRQSVSAVSLDEEMTDLVRFQHAYNAAARTITVMDEMFDKIINGMGIVGR
ncbi:flagellar hook-associated protein FlgK [Bacillaceae bacterium Marseille-Q3522]|nr:flagellar hook-associated protein FlgK [Bacillaceae bacterium Marseille-Q3522]